MSLQRDVLLKESFAQERRRRSLNIDLGFVGGPEVEADGNKAPFAVFQERNDDRERDRDIDDDDSVFEPSPKAATSLDRGTSQGLES